MNVPLGRVNYYTTRVKFQVCGSPHIHSFKWILNAPLLSKDNIQEYITFVDGIIRANVPDINNNEEFFNLVITYKFNYTQNQVGNITIVADVTLDIFSQIEQLQQFPCMIECQVMKKYRNVKPHLARFKST